jgi:hypothetical protein
MNELDEQRARELDDAGWKRVLMASAGEVFLVEAAIRLIARHG